ncbi:MAG: mechanosensitive ion channel domain-containing protein [Pyrinomonadaceae bacterium]
MIVIFQNTNAAARTIDNASYVSDVAAASINNLITQIAARLPYILAGVIVLSLFYLVARIIKAAFWAATRRTKLDNRLRILFSRLIVVFMVTLGVFTAFTVIIPSFAFGDLIAGLGFTSFVVGFATKDILNNLLSGVLILWQQPFKIGDYIFVGKDQGKVEFIGVRATSLRRDDGELVLIPNGDMYSSAVTIRGAGAKRRMTLKFNVAYDSDIEKAKKTISSALVQMTGVIDDPEPTVFVSDLISEGVLISVNFWINTDRDRPLEVFDKAASTILKAMNDSEIELFPPDSLIVQQAREAVTQEQMEEKRESAI